MVRFGNRTYRFKYGVAIRRSLLPEYASDNRFRERLGVVRNADRIWVSTPQKRAYRPKNKTNPANSV